MYCIVVAILFLYIICDVNYFFRAFFTVISGRILEKTYSLHDRTIIYGICTFQDCDMTFRSLRLARLLREIDIARFHFYDRTGIYGRSRLLKISSLQGCTLSSTSQPVGLFQIYKIITKLVYWDERSLFLEHEIVTLSDGKLRNVIVSRQYAIGKDGHTTEALLNGLKGAENPPSCPEYIRNWLRSNKISSLKLKQNDQPIKKSIEELIT